MPADDKKRLILMTGAAGGVGSYFRRHYADEYAYILTDKREAKDLNGMPFYLADLGDMDAVRAAFADPLVEQYGGIDTVLHLGADPRRSATWDTLLPSNVVGVYNVFETAAELGVRRVVFASSINSVLAYTERNLSAEAAPNAPNLYGATKGWGEAAASYYAAADKFSAICLRIGRVIAHDSKEMQVLDPVEDLPMVVTMRDLGEIIRLSIEAPDDVRYHVLNAQSNNREPWLDITETIAVLGFRPQDDAFKLAGR